MPVFELVEQLHVAKLKACCAICRCEEVAHGKIIDRGRPEGEYLCKACTVNHPDYRPPAPAGKRSIRLRRKKKRDKDTTPRGQVIPTVVNLFQDENRHLHVSEMRKLSGLSEQRIADAVKTLMKEGVLNRVGHGVYEYTWKLRPERRRNMTSSHDPDLIERLRRSIMEVLAGEMTVQQIRDAIHKSPKGLDYSPKSIRNQMISLYRDGIVKRNREKANKPYIYSVKQDGDIQRQG